jgi:hypothetical protein
MGRQKITLVLFIILWQGLSLVTNIFAQKPAESIPNFSFTKLDNTPFTNKNLAVGKDILFVFFDVNCDHCKETISSLSNRIKECNRIAIYLITLDDKPQISFFLNQNGGNLMKEKNVTILRDKKDQFITLFGPRKYPSVFLYSSKKKLLLYDDQDLKLEKFFHLINSRK